MSDASAELYQAIIDDHRRRPRNRGPLPSAHRVVRRENPACGDLCTMQLQLDPEPGDVAVPGETRIVAAAFTGAGCALSQASASLATVALSGLAVADARALIGTVERIVVGDTTAERVAPADLAALSAVRTFPARHACALLAWRAAADALSCPAPAS